MPVSNTPQQSDPAQSDIARGTPPAHTPGTSPESDVQPDQQPVRGTPDMSEPSADE